MPFNTGSRWGLGREQVPGTAVATGNQMKDTKGGIPIESFVSPDLGDMISIHPKMLGFPYDTERSRIHVGKEPKIPTMEHNVHTNILGVVLASMCPWTHAADVSTLKPIQAGQIVWTYGNSAVTNFTFTVWHEVGNSAGSHSVYISGCACTGLTLTFPQSGGPVRMSWEAVGMDSDEDQATQTDLPFEYPTASMTDLLASSFRYFYGTVGSPTEIYPDSDVVITLTPTIQVQRRCQDKPRVISVSRWTATAAFTFPWDADSDVHDRYQEHHDVTRAQLYISNATGGGAFDVDPDALGELTLCVQGYQDEAPGLGGEGILGEQVRLVGTGDATDGTYDRPFIMELFDDVTFDDFV